MPADILLGVVTAVQGLKGEVRVKTFGEAPDRLADYGPLHTPEGRNLEIASLRAIKGGGAVVRFNGIEDREAAERLVNGKLLVERIALPATAADEFYHADLIGLRAQDGEGRTVGLVRAMQKFGAADGRELEPHGGRSALLPFNLDVVPKLHI